MPSKKNTPYIDKSERAKAGYPMKTPRYHAACHAVYGVFRPGKTAVDKARGVNRTTPNRRVWDGSQNKFVKV